MDAIIGRYRARMEENCLVLKHPSGISFDLSIDETLGLMDFIKAYRQTLLILQRDRDMMLEREHDAIMARERDTDPQMERVILELERKEHS